MSETIVYGDPLATARISVATGRVPNLAVDAVISRHVGDALQGGVVYADYTHESVCVHVAGFCPGWLSRTFLFLVFDYAFTQMGVARVFSQIREDNLAALGFNRRLGFAPVAYIPGVFPGPLAMIVTKMEREECRWLALAQHYAREHVHG
jgi:RimJ/RimL family protein N-acetyltransferase